MSTTRTLQISGNSAVPLLSCASLKFWSLTFFDECRLRVFLIDCAYKHCICFDFGWKILCISFAKTCFFKVFGAFCADACCFKHRGYVVQELLLLDQLLGMEPLMAVTSHGSRKPFRPSPLIWKRPLKPCWPSQRKPLRSRLLLSAKKAASTTQKRHTMNL